VDELLPSVEAPTLIVDNREPYIGVGARMASSIPNAEYHVVDDKTWRAALPLMLDFVLREQVSLGGLGSGMSAILFLDIADSTSLTEAMGDAAFRAAARSLDEGMRNAIRGAGGAPVEGKVLGDGVMAVFSSAAEAIDAARRCVALTEATDLRLHLGIHAGDVLREQGNVYGGAVNTAARICGLSEPSEILVSGTIRDLARTSANVTFEDCGEHALKGIADPVRVYRIR
jgi:class 3 adenylate cyclase